jgi:dTDP-4-dehydrorhamnose reductase
MTRVLLLGATGMLGSALFGVLKNDYELVLAVRDPDKVTLLERAYGSTQGHQVVVFDVANALQDYVQKKGFPGPGFSAFLRHIGEVGFVVNAVGITIPYSLLDPPVTFFVNGALPHLLASIFGERLIHITTDCVYSGIAGSPYTENSPKSPVDLYGLSKSLGEPSECLTIRTSIIGRELEGFTGLLEWFLQQQGKTIKGFVNHFWNGITTRQFGELCHKIMGDPSKYPRRGVFHVFSTTLSKFEMLLKFQQKYGVRCTIVPDEQNSLNRTLGTVKELNGRLRVPSFDEMLDSLPNQDEA